MTDTETILPATTEPVASDMTAMPTGDWWQPNGIEEARQMCKWAAASEMVPNAYVSRPMDIFIAWSFGAPVGLSLLGAPQSIAVINGKPSLYGDAIPAVVQTNGGYFDEKFTGKIGSDDYTAVCECYRGGRMASRQEFSVADARDAGLWGKKGPWTQYPRRMLQVRARAFAARDAFADKLSGFSVVEEVDDYPARNVTAQATVSDTPPATRTAALMDRLKPEPPADPEPVLDVAELDRQDMEADEAEQMPGDTMGDLYDEVQAMIADLCDNDATRIGEATLAIEDRHGMILGSMDHLQLIEVRHGLEDSAKRRTN